MRAIVSEQAMGTIPYARGHAGRLNARNAAHSRCSRSFRSVARHRGAANRQALSHRLSQFQFARNIRKRSTLLARLAGREMMEGSELDRLHESLRSSWWLWLSTNGLSSRRGLCEGWPTRQGPRALSEIPEHALEMVYSSEIYRSRGELLLSQGHAHAPQGRADHRPHGTLTADATEPAWNGSCSLSGAHAVWCSGVGSRHGMLSWIYCAWRN